MKKKDKANLMKIVIGGLVLVGLYFGYQAMTGGSSPFSMAGAGSTFEIVARKGGGVWQGQTLELCKPKNALAMYQAHVKVNKEVDISSITLEVLPKKIAATVRQALIGGVDLNISRMGAGSGPVDSFVAETGSDAKIVINTERRGVPLTLSPGKYAFAYYFRVEKGPLEDNSPIKVAIGWKSINAQTAVSPGVGEAPKVVRLASRSAAVKRGKNYTFQECPADLQLSQAYFDAGSRNRVRTGDIVTLKLSPRNLGSGSARKPEITKPIISGFEFVGMEANVPTAFACSQSGNTLRCQADRNMPVTGGIVRDPSPWNVKPQFEVGKDVECGALEYIGGTIRSSTPDLVSGNNTITERRQVVKDCSCTDSDGGVNYNLKGTAEAEWNGQDLATDFCNNGFEVNISQTRVPSCSGPDCYVIDYYCGNGDIMTWGKTPCSSCNDGACAE